MPGVFITRGMTVSIPRLSFSLGPSGDAQVEPVILHVRVDVCSTWLRIAVRHLDVAIAARIRRDQIWSGTDQEAKAQALEDEFEASMQAIMAAAIAWDSVYAVLREYVSIPPAEATRWREGRTARYSQVAETVRRAFSLRPKGMRALRANLKEIYRYRDLAVHPSGKVEAALHHPELEVGVEWRFVYFRASNAKLAVLAAAAMLWDLANHATAKDSKITEYQKTLAHRLTEIFPNGDPAVQTRTAEGVP